MSKKEITYFELEYIRYPEGTKVRFESKIRWESFYKSYDYKDQSSDQSLDAEFVGKFQDNQRRPRWKFRYYDSSGEPKEMVMGQYEISKFLEEIVEVPEDKKEWFEKENHIGEAGKSSNKGCIIGLIIGILMVLGLLVAMAEIDWLYNALSALVLIMILGTIFFGAGFVTFVVLLGTMALLLFLFGAFTKQIFIGIGIAILVGFIHLIVSVVKDDDNEEEKKE
ncbi:MAG: hypothetical protein ACI4LK_00025 [Lentihominibacter sp.]